jgi:hypothetical protein
VRRGAAVQTAARCAPTMTTMTMTMTMVLMMMMMTVGSTLLLSTTLFVRLCDAPSRTELECAKTKHSTELTTFFQTDQFWSLPLLCNLSKKRLQN